MKDLRHKVTVITGAAGGLGRALAKECYRRGSHLALVDVDMPGLAALHKELPATDLQKVTIHSTDIASEAQVIVLQQELSVAYGAIDMLVNNAAVSISRMFADITPFDFEHLFRVNFWGTVYCTRHFLPHLLLRPDSRLVNIVSGFAQMGFPGKTAYGSSKAAVTGFTNALKTELAGRAVKVCLVIPPPLATGLVQNGIHVNEERKEREAAFVARNAMPLNAAAVRILNGVAKGRYRIVVGSTMFRADMAARLFPEILLRFIERNKRQYDFL